MKIKITAALAIVTVVLGILCLTSYLFSDRIAPEITVPFAEIVYEEGADKDNLLKGVSAVDDVDGDISAKVRIYDVAVMGDGEEALVTYAVYDDSYNLAKAYKVVSYVPMQDAEESENASETDLELESNSESGSNSDSNSNTDKATVTDAQAADDENVDGKIDNTDNAENTSSQQQDCVTAGYDDPPLVSEGAPVMRLRTHEIHITVGGSFYSMDYVDTAVDDKDSKNALYEKMYMDGYYNTKKPGEYELTYYCLDSDGNVSNMAKLKMIVTEMGE